MKLIYANSPRWANRSQTLIDLVVRFEEIDEDLPFTANPNDSEAHGRDIFSRAVAGEFGEIAAFNPTPYTTEQVIVAIKEERNRLIAETDWTQLPDVPQNVKTAWESYRQALRSIPQQSGFPWYETVVVEVNRGFSMDLAAVPWPSKPF